MLPTISLLVELASADQALPEPAAPAATAAMAARAEAAWLAAMAGQGASAEAAEPAYPGPVAVAQAEPHQAEPSMQAAASFSAAAISAATRQWAAAALAATAMAAMELVLAKMECQGIEAGRYLHRTLRRMVETALTPRVELTEPLARVALVLAARAMAVESIPVALSLL